MPIYLDHDPSREAAVTGITYNPVSGFHGSSAKCIHIGLINNMPDGALESTERQFLSLLDSAANGILVRLSLYAMPGVPRSESGRSHVNRFYSSVEELWDSQLDGLIVTGTEPKAQNLTEEPYWDSFTRVLEWADQNTYSSIWSCLAAHAAILHTDGISRRRLAEKRFGIFEAVQASRHALTASAPARFRVPHSRWNDIHEGDLTDCGYRILTRIQGGGVDSFIKQKRSLMVFFQGHPEYEGDTLLLEYRRDVRRYLRRERETYPLMPQDYFDSSTGKAFAALQERASSNGHEDALAQLQNASANNPANTWRAAGTQVYQNWLTYLSAQKKRRLKDMRGRKICVSPVEVGASRPFAQAAAE